MQHTHSLAKHLKISLGWHQSRIDLIALVIFGLIQMGSVNLSRIARTVGHGTEIDSRRKRLKRFFALSSRELDDIARMVVDWMVPEGNQVVCPDRTNRDFGLFKINIMMVAKQQVVIPAKEAVAKAGTIQLELISLQLHLSPHSPFISRFVTKLSLTERSGLVRNHARIESVAATSL
ncbi:MULTISPECIES: hypothetical protein [unclassified Endozoicomonas]|uniref:hypothetical protein n=1 Tax=unclassified Endozoicomonas TaxID=2644528 RepID=UPI0021498DAE|nr:MULTISPECIES: hypothetical protein [unclassified Endozoicomonas]